MKGRIKNLLMVVSVFVVIVVAGAFLGSDRPQDPVPGPGWVVWPVTESPGGQEAGLPPDGTWLALGPVDGGRRLVVTYGPQWDGRGCRIVMPRWEPADDGPEATGWFEVVCDGSPPAGGR